MGWKYELTGDAREVEFPVPGTGELVSIKKGKSVELDVLLTNLPPEVKVTETKTKKGDEPPAEEEGS
jgi:hypothetical protein